jgi:hypothetical protein
MYGEYANHPKFDSYNFVSIRGSFSLANLGANC